MGEEGYFIDADRRPARRVDPRRGRPRLQPDHRLRPRLGRRAGRQPLPPDAHDGPVPGGHRQGGPAAQGNLDRLSLYTQKPSPTTILVICHKEKSVDKRSALYKGCAANGAVLESVRPRDYEIAAWLQQFIRRRGLEIDPKALAMLTDHLGTDISKIANELQKLTVSLPEGTRRITDRDIEANIGISKDFNNFELCKAVVTRDMDARPDDRRPLRPQPEGQSAAADRHGPLQPVPRPLRRELPALARAPPQPALSARTRS